MSAQRAAVVVSGAQVIPSGAQVSPSGAQQAPAAGANDAAMESSSSGQPVDSSGQYALRIDSASGQHSIAPINSAAAIPRASDPPFAHPEGTPEHLSLGAFPTVGDDPADSFSEPDRRSPNHIDPRLARARAPGLDAALSGPTELPTDPEPAPYGGFADQLDLSPGKMIGHFVIQSQLGEGGMGVVLAGHDADLGRPVAIKLVRNDTNHPAYRARLLREAQAMARLEHPHVARVYEIGNHDGRLFVAMELVDGVTLTAWMRERTRSWRELVDLFLQIGSGLAAVHSAGLVHRDFKPDNVLVDKLGKARVVDFGLARVDLNTASSTMSPELAASLTRSGIMLGTPGYIAPEQQFGAGVDARADQYSFCVALREGLLGSRIATADDPRWQQVPKWLRNIVTRGLSYDADERYPGMTDLLSDLERGNPRRRRVLTAVIATLVVVGGVAGGFAIAARSSTEAGDRIAASADRTVVSADRTAASADRTVASADRTVASADRIVVSGDRTDGASSPAQVAAATARGGSDHGDGAPGGSASAATPRPIVTPIGEASSSPNQGSSSRDDRSTGDSKVAAADSKATATDSKATATDSKATPGAGSKSTPSADAKSTTATSSSQSAAGSKATPGSKSTSAADSKAAAGSKSTLGAGSPRIGSSPASPSESKTKAASGSPPSSDSRPGGATNSKSPTEGGPSAGGSNGGAKTGSNPTGSTPGGSNPTGSDPTGSSPTDSNPTGPTASKPGDANEPPPRHAFPPARRPPAMAVFSQLGYRAAPVDGTDLAADEIATAAKINATSDDLLEKGKLQWILGEIQRKRGHCSEAISSYLTSRKTLAAYNNDNRHDQRMWSYFSFDVLGAGLCQFEMGHADEAIKVLDSALSTSWAMGEVVHGELLAAIGILEYETRDPKRGKDTIQIGYKYGDAKLRGILETWAKAVGMQ